MAKSKDLQRNVMVDGVWYGPAWPDNEVTPAVHKALEGNDLVYTAPPAPDAAGTAFGPSLATPGMGVDPDADEHERLMGLERDDLLKLAEARNVEVSGNAQKKAVVDAILAASRSGA